MTEVTELQSQQQSLIHICVYRKNHIKSFFLSAHPTGLETLMTHWVHRYVKLIHCCSLEFMNTLPLKYKLCLYFYASIIYFPSFFSHWDMVINEKGTWFWKIFRSPFLKRPQKMLIKFQFFSLLVSKPISFVFMSITFSKKLNLSMEYLIWSKYALYLLV